MRYPVEGKRCARPSYFSPGIGSVVRAGRQRTAEVTPISPSMPIYADVYLTRYQEEVDAPLLLREIKDTRAPRRGPYM